MNIIVCVKPVSISRDAREDILRSGTIQKKLYTINPPDLYAIEEARKISLSSPGTTIQALLLGPPDSETVLREALARGADTAVQLITYEDVRTAREAAMLLARYIRTVKFDMVLTGIMGEDTADGSMGPMLAAFLGVPFAWGAMAMDCDRKKGSVYVECELEGGDRLHADMVLPALVSVGTGINQPPYPKLSSRLAARVAQVESIHCSGMKQPFFEKVESIEPVPLGRHGVFLQGTCPEKADHLVRLLRQRALV